MEIIDPNGAASAIEDLTARIKPNVLHGWSIWVLFINRDIGEEASMVQLY